MDFNKFRKNRGKMQAAVTKMKDKKPSYIDDRFWKPMPDKQGNADAVIRFLPQQDPEAEPVIMRHTHFFKENGKWFVELCPRTNGKECPADEYGQPYWDLAKEHPKESDEYKRLAGIASKYCNSKEFIANILVVNDLARPENNGKVFLYKFGVKIFNKIMDKLAPESEIDEPVMVYDLWEGRNFKLKMRKESGWIKYDNSEWFDSNTPVAKDEDGIERIYNQIRSLAEFVDPKLFKDYVSLKKKFIEVVGANAAKFFAASKSEGAAEHTQTVEGPSKEKASAPADADDDMVFDDADATATNDATDPEPDQSDDGSEPEQAHSDDFDFDFDEDDFNFDADSEKK